MTAETKNEALRKPAPTTIQIQQATRGARRRSIFWYWLAGACALGAASEAVAGVFNVGGEALLSWQILVMVLILAFLAVLFKWAGWSAGRYATAVDAGGFVREQQEVLAAHRSLYLFLALIALATLIVVGLTWGWIAVVFGALLVYPFLFVLLVFAGVLEYESWDFGDENCRGNFFRDRYGMMLGPDDSTEAGDNLLASHLWADDD